MDDARYFLIGPGAGDLMGRRVPETVITFESTREFDLWRQGQTSGELAPTIEVDVRAALREIRRPRADLDGEVLAFIDALCKRRIVPARVEDLIPSDRSRSSFYRAWSKAIPEPPKQFLDRVRLLYARRLIEQQGLSRKEAAYLAGYGSTWLMGQAILRRAERNAGISRHDAAEEI
jgi:AraC-like DNA-binding protein